MNFYAVSFQLVSSVAVGLVTAAYGRTLNTSDLTKEKTTVHDSTPGR